MLLLLFCAACLQSKYVDELLNAAHIMEYSNNISHIILTETAFHSDKDGYIVKAIPISDILLPVY